MGLIDNIMDNVLNKFGVTDEDIQALKKAMSIAKKIANNFEFKEESNGDIRVTINPKPVTIFIKTK